MLQNTYSLPDLIDLALKVPEEGAVNFNILHTVLHAIVKELKITDVRPWCNIENPLLAKTTAMKAKLRQTAKHRVPEPDNDKSKKDSSDETYGQSNQKPSKEEKTTGALPERRDSSVQVEDTTLTTTTVPSTTTSTTTTIPSTTPSTNSTSTTTTIPSTTPSTNTTSTTTTIPSTTSMSSTDTTSTSTTAPPTTTTPEKTERLLSELEEHPAVTDETIEDEKQHGSQEPSKTVEESPTPELDRARRLSEKSIEAMSALKESSGTVPDEPAKKSGKGRHLAENAWKYTNLNMRVEATEEALHRLSNIVDIIADKIRKAELRKKAGGPSSEELEAIDERLLEVEEALARYAKDHELLMKINETLENILREFEAIKALASLLKQMQIDLSKKADKEETWAALELKADLELVNTKVDQVEFETAIEELGEAIGLLGIKFTRKNDEWEERAAEMWKAIDGKMTLDVFEAARVKIESRLTALLYGLKRLKKVVEDLLYPESSGVTRCILCRRPACISGLECLGSGESPEPILSDRSSGEPDRKNIFLSSLSSKQQKTLSISLDAANDSSTPQN